MNPLLSFRGEELIAIGYGNLALVESDEEGGDCGHNAQDCGKFDMLSLIIAVQKEDRGL